MNKIYYLFALCFLCVSAAYNQSAIGFCGTSFNDNTEIKNRMLENRKDWKNNLVTRGGALTYVPINFWLIAKNDGTERLAYKNVIENLCCLNELYSEFGIAFYLNGIFTRNNTYIFDDPSSTLGIAYIDQIMTSNYNALNVFVTKVANATVPGVLAFYRPADNSKGDYIVCNKNNLNFDCTTLAHEVGHYFSLAHTFYGWENTVYNDITAACTKPTPTSVTAANGQQVLVEYVDRNKPGTIGGTRNCEQAADGFCDTPADYNLGFGWTGNCTFTGCTKDPDNVKLDPQETNLMGYFLNCISVFSQEQKDAITMDLLSAKRNYLRKTTHTERQAITDPVKYLTPTANSPAIGYDTVKFDWEDVPNAEFYIFDLAQNTGFNLFPVSFILKRSDTTLTNLKKNTNYHWRVTPYNLNSFCPSTAITSFRTPSWTVASENIELDKVKSFIFHTSNNQVALTIITNESQTLELDICNTNGQVIYNIKQLFVQGETTIDFKNLQPGLYYYRLTDQSSRKSNTAKFVTF